MAKSTILSIIESKGLNINQVFNDVTVMTGEHDASVAADVFWGKRSYNSKIKWFTEKFMGDGKPSKSDKFTVALFEYLRMSEVDIERFWVERSKIQSLKSASTDVKDEAGINDICNSVYENLDEYVEKDRILKQEKAEQKAKKAAEKANKPKRVRKSKASDVLAEALEAAAPESASAADINSKMIDDALGVGMSL